MIDISVLKKYRQNVEIVELEKVKSFLSEEWTRIFSETNSEVRVKMTINLWKKYCSKELRNTILCLEDNLKDVILVKTDLGLSVIYSILFGNGNIDYYEGVLPSVDYKDLFEDWSKFPESMKLFYTKIHNGFYYYPTITMGLLPVQSITNMDEFDWEVVNDLGLEIKIDFKQSYIVFETGMGGYLVIDTRFKSDDCATVWFSNSKPIYNKNMWDILDEWIIMGFDY